MDRLRKGPGGQQDRPGPLGGLHIHVEVTEVDQDAEAPERPLGVDDAAGERVAINHCRIIAAQGEFRGVRLGGSAPQDLVAHAAELDRGFGSLNDYVSDVVTRLDGRLSNAEQRLDGAITYHGLVRYDAYNEMSGRQSTSLALLDSSGSGIVLSSIHHRDQARLYAKQVVEGRGTLELSPEEEEAVRVALAREVPDAAERRR